MAATCFFVLILRNCYGRPPAMLALGHSVLRLTLSFTSFFLSFFGGSSPDFATCSMVTQIYKIQSEICPPPTEIWRPKNIKILARFRTASRLDRESPERFRVAIPTDRGGEWRHAMVTHQARNGGLPPVRFRGKSPVGFGTKQLKHSLHFFCNYCNNKAVQGNRAICRSCSFRFKVGR